MTKSTRYGYISDGTLSPCRAQPGNEGRYGCNHSDHMDVAQEKIAAGFIDEYNALAIQIHMKKQGISEITTLRKSDEVVETDDDSAPTRRAGLPTKPLVPGVGAVRFKKAPPVKNSFNEKQRALRKKSALKSEARKSEPPRRISRYSVEALQEAATEIFENDTTDYSVSNELYGEFGRNLPDDYVEADPDERAKMMEDFLRSENPVARRVREYIDDDEAIHNVSRMLTAKVLSMSAKVSRSRGSLSRSFLTHLGHNMDDKAYVASVIFFKGKCCYCGRLMEKGAEDPKHKATGEHLTPLSPEQRSAPRGSTRFGNMALACADCNGDRSNQEMLSWITTSGKIDDDEQPGALAKIMAFRKFAGYREFTAREGKLVNDAMRRMRAQELAAHKEFGKNTPEANEFLEGVFQKELNKVERLVLREENKDVEPYDLSNDERWKRTGRRFPNEVRFAA